VESWARHCCWAAGEDGAAKEGEREGRKRASGMEVELGSAWCLGRVRQGCESWACGPKLRRGEFFLFNSFFFYFKAFSNRFKSI